MAANDKYKSEILTWKSNKNQKELMLKATCNEN